MAHQEIRDLESAAKVDQPPGLFRSCAWTDHTLTGGLYTAASDIEMVGQLMAMAARQMQLQLSQAGIQLAALMKDPDALARPNAKAALAHDWFPLLAGSSKP